MLRQPTRRFGERVSAAATGSAARDVPAHTTRGSSMRVLKDLALGTDLTPGRSNRPIRFG
jgi:hypothetical protein